MSADLNPLIVCRDDLSFTLRDECGRLISWPLNNPGVAADWDKGMAYFDNEVACLAAHDETEAFHAIEFAIEGMAARVTCLEIGFARQVAAAAVIGLRAMRQGVPPFAPVED